MINSYLDKHNLIRILDKKNNKEKDLENISSIMAIKKRNQDHLSERKGEKCYDEMYAYMFK